MYRYPSLGIPPCGTITPVEGPSVLGVHGGNFSARIVAFGGLCSLEDSRTRSRIFEKLPRSTSNLPPKYPHVGQSVMWIIR